MRLSTRSLVALAAVGLALGNLGRIPAINIVGRGGAVAVMDLLLLPLWTLLLVTLARRTRHWKLDGFSLSLLAFVAIAALSTVLAGPKWNLSLGSHFAVAAFLVRWVLYGGWYLLIVTDPEPDAAGRDAWAYIERAILVILVLGILQSAFLPNVGAHVEALTGIYYDHQGRRLVSTVLDPNFAGGLLAILLMMRLAREAEGIHTNRWVLLAIVLGIILTLSRAAWLALIVALSLLVLIRGLRGSLLRLAAVGTVIMLPALPAIIAFGSAFRKFEIDPSALQRVSVWLRGVALIRENPILGVGFNAAGPAQLAHGWETYGGSTSSMDGGILFVAVLTGLVGVTAYLGMVWFFSLAARRTWRDPNVPAERRAFALGGWLSLVVIIVQSLPANALLSPWLMLPLWIIQARVMATAPAAVPRKSRRSLSVPARALAVPAILLLLVSACDPCAGVASCSVSPQLSITGTIVSAESREPRAGVLVRVSDPIITGDRVSLTDARGRWQITIPSANDSVVTVQVISPDAAPYAVAQNVRASTVAGEALDVGLWYDQPVFNSVVGVSRAGTFGSASTFRFEVDSSLGGAVIEGETAAVGFALLRGVAPNTGVVNGTLVVNCCGLGLRRYPGYRLEADYKVEVERVRSVLDVGRQFAFGGIVRNRGTQGNTGGATVTWTRTSGLQTTPSSVTTTSLAGGDFYFSVDMHGWGESRGTMTVTPPGGPPTSTPNFRLFTFDGYGAQAIGVAPHGEQWIFLMGARRASDSTAIAWTNWTFTRDSGVVITPAVVGFTTGGDGRFYLGASVSDTGFVHGTLRFQPASGPAYSAGTVSLRTYAADPIPTLPFRYVVVP